MGRLADTSVAGQAVALAVGLGILALGQTISLNMAVKGELIRLAIDIEEHLRRPT